MKYQARQDVGGHANCLLLSFPLEYCTDLSFHVILRITQHAPLLWPYLLMSVCIVCVCVGEQPKIRAAAQSELDATGM